MKSISNMVVQLGGICGTNDLSEWEEGFIDSMFDYYDSGIRKIIRYTYSFI